MRYWQRYLLVLCASVMCVGAFSTIVNAETLPKHTFSVSTVSSVTMGDRVSASITSYPENGTTERGTKSDWFDYSMTVPNDVRLESAFTVANDNGSSLFFGGMPTIVRFQNIYASFLFSNESTPLKQKYFYHHSASTLNAMVFYEDGTVEIIEDLAFLDKGNGIYDLSLSFTPSKDVKKINFNILTYLTGLALIDYNLISDMGLTYVTINTGEHSDTNNFFSVEQEGKEVGLLEAIKDKLVSGFQALGDSIRNGLNAVTESVDNVVESVTELPNNLWAKIENGLKNLFIPDEESMTAYKDKWDLLLASRFGAVYQVCELVTDSLGAIREADAMNTVEFPSVSIPLPEGAQFTFGGYDVKIVPDGFDWLAVSVKLVVGIVCTLAFINGMLKKYNELMGVEQ